MKTTYFKTIFQRSDNKHTIMITVVPNDMIGNNLPEIFEAQAFQMPCTIYTGMYPTIKINTETIKDRRDLIGTGIAGIITSETWYAKDEYSDDLLGIAL